MPSAGESGLEPNEERPHILFVGPAANASWLPDLNNNISYHIPKGRLCVGMCNCSHRNSYHNILV